MTAAHRRQAPRERGGSGEDQQHAVAELRERAAMQARALVTGEDWAAWLRIAARLPGWSFTNLLLIAAQQPSATLIAGYQEWRAQGRHVRCPGAVDRQRAELSDEGPGSGLPSAASPDPCLASGLPGSYRPG